MNRKTFLATVAAILSAPFVVKSEPKKPTLEDWIKANPEIMNRILENAITSELTRRLKDRMATDEIARFYNTPLTDVIRPSDYDHIPATRKFTMFEIPELYGNKAHP